jgi:hypothetical protein
LNHEGRVEKEYLIFYLVDVHTRGFIEGLDDGMNVGGF